MKQKIEEKEEERKRKKNKQKKTIIYEYLSDVVKMLNIDYYV